MPHNSARRRLGTILMGLGLIVILMVAGYLAWSEIQGAQVRTRLQQSASAATQHGSDNPAAVAAARTATPPATKATEPTQTEWFRAVTITPAAPTATHTPAQPTATHTPSLPAATRTPSLPAATQPAATATSAPRATAAPPTSIPAPAATIASNEPVRMTIPDLKIDAEVVPMGWAVIQTNTGPVSQWTIPKNAAGHHINSAGLGEPGNLVISGHNNIFGQVFKPISLAWDNDARVKVDDFTDESDILNGRTIELFDAGGKRYPYTVTGFYRLKDTGVSQEQRIANGRFIQPTDDKRLTIVTCWPPTNNTHRLIVMAEPAE